eukprot:365875-Chlamydomonas_euryale.AAC.5
MSHPRTPHPHKPTPLRVIHTVPPSFPGRAGCLELLARSGVRVAGRSCVIMGDSNVVGTPLAAMLRDRGAASVTVCHRTSYAEWFEDQVGRGSVFWRLRGLSAGFAVWPFGGVEGLSHHAWVPTKQPLNSAATIARSRSQPCFAPSCDCQQVRVEERRRAAAACLPQLPGPREAPPPRVPSAPADPLPGFQAHRLPDITRTADILVVAVG